MSPSEDYVEDDPPDFEASLATSQLVRGAITRPELRAAAGLDAFDQRRLFREARRLAKGFYRSGDSFDAIVEKVTAKIAADPKFSGILTVILLAALAATVRFWVSKFWERWFGD